MCLPLPKDRPPGAAHGFVWIIDRPDRAALMDQLRMELDAWFAGLLPHPVAITWHHPPD
ncbi:hypothetical protein [Mameliella sp.]|uniref:hypothetical protein n=1 Tax=Mameliella sp. TaxID=1924940 RepID=UPI003B50CBDA